MKSVAQVLTLLRQEIKAGVDRELDANPIGNVRLRQLLLMEDCLNAIGFPSHAEHKAQVSLVPYLFQEANYDDLSWTDQQADLGHLRLYFELDCMVQNQGRERGEISTDEFKRYVEDSFGFIDQAQAKRE